TLRRYLPSQIPAESPAGPPPTMAVSCRDMGRIRRLFDGAGAGCRGRVGAWGVGRGGGTWRAVAPRAAGPPAPDPGTPPPHPPPPRHPAPTPGPTPTPGPDTTKRKRGAGNAGAPSS